MTSHDAHTSMGGERYHSYTSSYTYHPEGPNSLARIFALFVSLRIARAAVL